MSVCDCWWTAPDFVFPDDVGVDVLSPAVAAVPLFSSLKMSKDFDESLPI